MDIFNFALFTKFEDNLKFLTNLADHEPWNFANPQKELSEGNNSARYPYPVLRNYLEHTFRKVFAENKISYTEDSKFCCFNTGLVTTNLEDIYAYFEENKSYNKQSPFFFRAFIKESDREFLSLFSDKIPDSANYFEKPEDLIFNPKLKLIIDIDHVIQDSKHRFPSPYKEAPDRMVRNALTGAVDEISKMIKTNYRIAIPTWYEGKIHLLLPLFLTSHNKPDLALVAEKINEKTYSVQACLTVGMAYNNARLITRPRREWVGTAIQDEKDGT